MYLVSWYHLNLFVHLVAVSLWLGMTVNFSLMTVPYLRKLPDSMAEQYLSSLGQRARQFVVGLMVVILLTGVVNLYRMGLMTNVSAWERPYGVIAGIKIGLALLLFLAFPFLFVVVHRYGSQDLEDRITRMNWLHWGVTGITLVIMFLGVMLRG